MNKELYESPVIDIKELYTEDVLTASNDENFVDGSDWGWN